MSGLNLVGFDAWGDGPSAAACQAANVSFRTWYSSSDPTKDAASGSALAAYAAEGIWSIVNYERLVNDYVGGYAAGVANFNHAVAEYVPYGMPLGAVVILSVDMNVPVDDFPKVLPYFQGARAAAAGKYRVGCYGEQALIAYLKANGVCDVGWKSMSTSFPGGGSIAGCDLVQTQGGTIGGASIDWNTNKSDLSLIGCWKPGQLYPGTPALGAVAPTPTTSKEDDMAILIRGASQTFYLLSGNTLHTITSIPDLSAYQSVLQSVQTVTAEDEARLLADFAPVSAASIQAAVQAGVAAALSAATLNVQAGLTAAQTEAAIEAGVTAALHAEGQKL